MNTSAAGEREPPDLSVVVPGVNGRDTLLDTLDALVRQRGALRLEILVPERTGSAVRAAVRDRFPETVILPVEQATSIPTMRRLAFEAASAGVVAVIEDHIIVPSDWAQRLLDAVHGGHPVVGGWVSNAATDRLVDRAAYFCEYGHMLTPLPSGPVDWVTGNNVAYESGLLRRFWHVIQEDRWEDRLHSAFREGGEPLTLRADIIVEHKMHYRSALEYAGQRYLYSRAFAGMRLRGAGLLKAVLYSVGACALPAVLLARIVKSGWAAPRFRADLAKSLPLLVMFVSAWALGEAVGALAGPGDALGRVR